MKKYRYAKKYGFPEGMNSFYYLRNVDFTKEPVEYVERETLSVLYEKSPKLGNESYMPVLIIGPYQIHYVNVMAKDEKLWCFYKQYQEPKELQGIREILLAFYGGGKLGPNIKKWKD